jgi:hypothetical protein
MYKKISEKDLPAQRGAQCGFRDIEDIKGR